MKKFIKNNIFGFLIGIISMSAISVLAVNYLYRSEDISYDDKSVKEAIDELYESASIMNQGDATADNISEGKTAVVNGVLITGNGKDNQISFNSGMSANMPVVTQGTTFVAPSSGKVYATGSIHGANNYGDTKHSYVSIILTKNGTQVANKESHASSSMHATCVAVYNNWFDVVEGDTFVFSYKNGFVAWSIHSEFVFVAT